jgi:hypothetical protein
LRMAQFCASANNEMKGNEVIGQQTGIFDGMNRCKDIHRSESTKFGKLTTSFVRRLMSLGRMAESGHYGGSFLRPSFSSYCRLSLPHSRALSLFSFLECALSPSQSFWDARGSQEMRSLSLCFSGSVCLNFCVAACPPVQRTGIDADCVWLRSRSGAQRTQ